MSFAFKLSETDDYKKIVEERKKRARNKRNHKNKMRRKERKKEYLENHPKPERVEDVLKAVSEKRRKK